MANIASSAFTASAQKDGRSIVSEVHTDLLGLKHDIGYLAAADADLNAALAQHANDLGNNLDQAEVSDNINQVLTLGSLASPSLRYSTAAENFSALREAYRNSTQTQAVMIGDFLNTLTSQQIQNAFGLTAGQVTTLKTNKLAPAAALAASIRSSAGQ